MLQLWRKLRFASSCENRYLTCSKLKRTKTVLCTQTPNLKFWAAEGIVFMWIKTGLIHFSCALIAKKKGGGYNSSCVLFRVQLRAICYLGYMQDLVMQGAEHLSVEVIPRWAQCGGRWGPLILGELLKELVLDGTSSCVTVVLRGFMDWGSCRLNSSKPYGRRWC